MPRCKTGRRRHHEFVDQHQPSAIAKRLKEVDILLINDGEAKLLAGDSSLPRAARKSGDGAASAGHQARRIRRDDFFSRGHRLDSSVSRPGPADRRSAGSRRARATRLPADSWATSLRKASWTVVLTEGACFYGGVMGSFAVERFGTERLQTLTREEIEERFGVFRELTHLE